MTSFFIEIESAMIPNLRRNSCRSRLAGDAGTAVCLMNRVIVHRQQAGSYKGHVHFTSGGVVKV
ncbi:hypothetical protein D3C76_1753690 [compost metagenome]